MLTEFLRYTTKNAFLNYTMQHNFDPLPLFFQVPLSQNFFSATSVYKLKSIFKWELLYVISSFTKSFLFSINKNIQLIFADKEGIWVVGEVLVGVCE